MMDGPNNTVLPIAVTSEDCGGPEVTALRPDMNGLAGTPGVGRITGESHGENEE